MVSLKPHFRIKAFHHWHDLTYNGESVECVSIEYNKFWEIVMREILSTESIADRVVKRRRSKRKTLNRYINLHPLR